jgi:hypothetical protein
MMMLTWFINFGCFLQLNQALKVTLFGTENNSEPPKVKLGFTKILIKAVNFFYYKQIR